mmetsp:Transcript_34012/g.107273  ORF Transcript_34012/g.107273 Transcript_34012/m.107273 type:complete len:257 (-) Transcript_34012:476-1246(-)|eukprot:CAMPEP_0118864514 /NCGR_PEP_ID=MMETSP1163-20130328/9075_1 /TAXON_ID=124430 /ORGANISM="Phaeomonas parva, Strain CCMP2877" /LENGTH=256 /DNA_ID=CAMNT_0006798653 /DNA_START=93 /DNA_END=863 /DNA_ORIENTATION=+
MATPRLLLLALLLATAAGFRPPVTGRAVRVSRGALGLRRRAKAGDDAEDIQAKLAAELGLKEEGCAAAPSTSIFGWSSLQRDRALALGSAVLAAAAYFFQASNPVSAVALLHQMEAESPELTRALSNGKPTIVDIYADWCDNCRALAPTTRLLEKEFGGQVNWVTVRGDAPTKESAAIVNALRADAIPHYAFINADGEVVTSLVGLVPPRILREDVSALAERRAVPYVMYDAYKQEPSHLLKDYLGRDFFGGAEQK